ncbi:hypothetical protein BCV70DRAFT_217704 [Testicularia cyperi]|uniref:Structure-specific endonuclease subunit SLX4 n=1 Tax=Testicularia cyperi TaxID=1882483 RepID=A0A317XLX6_9BASI|nr:hypothetical protein BCV70DRAFT_217704 [Testicularia cyperi]
MSRFASSRSTRSSTKAAGSRDPVVASDTVASNVSPSLSDLEEWSLESLQKEVTKYGFKTSRRKATLIEQLRAVYSALAEQGIPFDAAPELNDEAQQKAQNASASGSNTDKGKARLVIPTSLATAEKSKISGACLKSASAKGKGRQSDPFVLSSSQSSSDSTASAVGWNARDAQPAESNVLGLDSIRQDEAEDMEREPGDLTLQLEAEAGSSTSGRSGLSSADSLHSDGSDSDVPLATLGAISSVDAPSESMWLSEASFEQLSEAMTRAIKQDQSLWLRILRYEPISFDELVSLATQIGLSMDTARRKDLLRLWLDRQCICFYTAELTGTRSRH